jgi:hypothetical protein
MEWEVLRVGQSCIHTPYLTVYLTKIQDYHVYTVYIRFWPTLEVPRRFE